MKNIWKIVSILGISLLAMMLEAGTGFLLFVLLIYFEFVYNRRKE